MQRVILTTLPGAQAAAVKQRLAPAAMARNKARGGGALLDAAAKGARAKGALNRSASDAAEEARQNGAGRASFQ
jgi:hypothetical protein